jgi:hypothetical protein
MEKGIVKTYKPKASNIRKLDVFLKKITKEKGLIKQQDKIKWDGF